MAITRTAQQVIQITGEHVKIDPIRALQLLNEAHLYILGELHMIPDVTYDIPLVAGTQEYALPDSVVKIWDAAYFNSSGDHSPVKATNVDTLFHDVGPNWQLQSSGTPSRFYERGGMIGLYPTPSSTTAGSYPKVTLYYTQVQTLGLGDTLPTTIPSIYPWVYHICAREAIADGDPKGSQFYQAQFEMEMNKMRIWVYGRVPRDRPRVRFSTPQVRRA